MGPQGTPVAPAHRVLAIVAPWVTSPVQAPALCPGLHPDFAVCRAGRVLYLPGPQFPHRTNWYHSCGLFMPLVRDKGENLGK